MDHLYLMLKDIIVEEVSAYNNMLLLSKQKKEELVTNNVHGLDLIVKNENKLLKNIKQLGIKREGLIKELAVTLLLPQEKTSLQTIIDTSNGRTNAVFTQLKTALQNVISELSALNKLNKTLIDTHLEYSTFCMEVLAGQIGTPNTYTPAGDVYEEKSSRFLLLDTKV